MTRRVALISCSAVKLDHAVPAKDLYQGQLFKLARRYCEGLLTYRGVPYVFDEWAILSAKHGLVLPEQRLEPYDLALGDLPREEQRAWGERTGQKIVDRWGTGVIYTVLAGRLYLEATKGLPMVEDYFGHIAQTRREDGKRTAYGIGLMKRDLKKVVQRIEAMQKAANGMEPEERGPADVLHGGVDRGTDRRPAGRRGEGTASAPVQDPGGGHELGAGDEAGTPIPEARQVARGTPNRADAPPRQRDREDQREGLPPRPHSSGRRMNLSRRQHALNAVAAKMETLSYDDAIDAVLEDDETTGEAYDYLETLRPGTKKDRRFRDEVEAMAGALYGSMSA